MVLVAFVVVRDQEGDDLDAVAVANDHRFKGAKCGWAIRSLFVLFLFSNPRKSEPAQHRKEEWIDDGLTFLEERLGVL